MILDISENGLDQPRRSNQLVRKHQLVVETPTEELLETLSVLVS